MSTLEDSAVDAARLPRSGFVDSPAWYAGVSAFWFATSFKWFVLLQVVLSAQVEAVVPAGTKNTYWGIVFAIGAVWATFGPAIFGHLSDRSARRRRFIAIGAGLTLIALAFLARANSLWMLIIGYLLLQVSDDVGTGPYSALIPETVPENRRGVASGALGIFRLFAWVIGGATVFVLSRNLMAVYAVIAAFNVICALITLWTMRDAAHHAMPKKPVPSGSFFQAWLKPWRSADFRWVWLSAFLGALAFYLIQPYVRNYLKDAVQDFSFFNLFSLGSSAIGTEEDRNSATAQAAAVLVLTIALVGAFGAYLAGRYTDKIGRKKVVMISGFTMFAALVPFALIHSYSAIFLMAIVFGLGYGARLSADWALAADVLPNADELGKDMGIWQMSQSSVQVFAGSAGVLITLGNDMYRGVGGYVTSILLAACIYLISTLLVQKVRSVR